MNESKASLSRANMYAHLGAQYCSNIASQASSGNYVVGELHTERTMLTREQIAARCRKQRLEAGLPVYGAPRILLREAQPPQRDCLLRQATAMASRLWNTAETLLHVLTPRFPGAEASALGNKGTGDIPAPEDALEKGDLNERTEQAALPSSSIDRFTELVESLGLHASYSHQFLRLDASDPARRASWMVTPSFDPAMQAVDDLLVFLESTQPGNLRQTDQLKMMLSYLFEQGMRTFTASPDVLKGFPCSTVANCVPVQSICDGKVLLDTVLAATGKGNVVLLPPEAIESLANMLSPAYANATEDFVWVSASRMRALEPQYRINCTSESPTGQAGAPTDKSCAENDRRSVMIGLAFGIGGALLGSIPVMAFYFRHTATNAASTVTQRIPLQIGENHATGRGRDDMGNDVEEARKNKIEAYRLETLQHSTRVDNDNDNDNN
ncbi:MAG TPA: hypothetical protein VF797_20345 [Noviherbaspirillum sp.]